MRTDDILSTSADGTRVQHNYADARQRPARRKTSALEWAKAYTEPGKASAYIVPFRVRPGDRFVIVCRVSSHPQKLRGYSLDAQEKRIRDAIEAQGGIVVAVVRHEWSGRGACWLRKLAEAANLADDHDAILIAATTDRFI